MDFMDVRNLDSISQSDARFEHPAYGGGPVFLKTEDLEKKA